MAQRQMDPRELTGDLLLGPVFDALPVGVVVLDEAGLVRVFNKHEERLANRQRARVIGRAFFEDVAPCMNVQELAGEFFDHVRTGSLDTRVEFSVPFPHVTQPRDVVVRMQSVIVAGAPHGLLLVEDVTMQRAVERLKESLATLLVHDFKNPLSAIRTNLEYLRAFASPEGVEAVDDSLAATQQLHGMVLNLLDIARLETGTFAIERQPTDVAALVGDAVKQGAAVARVSEVVLVADAAPVTAPIDPAAVRRCLANLIENAIRHAPARSRVVVSCAEEAGSVVLRVADEGPGVPAPLRATIFDKFAQGAAGHRASDNRGLGLTFVRMVAHAHGGEVAVLDTPRGATFELRLPAA
ncbi:MAG: sensor hybrid histidine kinase [Labilithrix sp.]|nr:sensor hybrid histidine kinase [Labilithrix sp.]